MKRLLAIFLMGSLVCGMAGCSLAGGGSPTAVKQGGGMDYPQKELRIEVPFQTGGALDIQARTTAKYLSKELGVNVIVENVTGAGGLLGTTEYLKEEADTSTILLTDGWLMTVTPLLNTVEYSMDDYIPIIDHNSAEFCLFASPSKTGISSYEDMKTYGADKKLLFGSGGAGTSLYILQKSLMDAMGLQSETITQNGTAEGLANLMAGTVDITAASFKDAADYVENGEIVPILCFGESAYSGEYTYAAGVPSAKDKGIELIYKGFYYYSIRKGTDQAIVDKLYDAFSRVYENPEFIAEQERIDFKAMGMDSDEIRTYLTEFSDMAKSNFSLE